MAGAGFEQPPNSKRKTAIHSQSGAQSGAPRAPGVTLADADGESPTLADPGTDPLLGRLMDAYARLSAADRLRLVDEAERLADAAGANVEAQDE